MAAAALNDRAWSLIMGLCVLVPEGDWGIAKLDSAAVARPGRRVAGGCSPRRKQRAIVLDGKGSPVLDDAAVASA